MGILEDAKGQPATRWLAPVRKNRGEHAPGPPTSRHTAHNHASELTIHYRFHPCVGEKVKVKHRRPAPSGNNLYVHLLSSGRPLAIREWMTRPEAAACAVCDHPRLSRQALSDLRMIVDSVACNLVVDGGNDDAQLADDTTTAAVRTGRARSHPGGRAEDGTAGSPGATDPGGSDEPHGMRGRRT